MGHYSKGALLKEICMVYLCNSLSLKGKKYDKWPLLTVVTYAVQNRSSFCGKKESFGFDMTLKKITF
jgi:hypothetical protein